MFCRQCGKQLPENTRFCSGCGFAQEPAQNQNQGLGAAQTGQSSASFVGDSTIPMGNQRRDLHPMGAPQNNMAVLGFIFSFLFPLVGLILCIVALKRSKTMYNGRGRGFAIAGIIISILMFWFNYMIFQEVMDMWD